ncbi:hypothetical protein PVAND_017657 [Polypedilum vanderplanki]|uniref:Peptidase S1 domain-containing protein n=1 Tax=Polypedilum vanderplanki TaxID=319348 RepID=A0A9J6B9G9_POLVA|nr:hypothetical protein PVAND_017657 [Polypedilum vanderplanki]
MFRKLLIILSAVFAINAFPDRLGRIVNGDLAVVGQVPFQVSLRAWGTTFHFAGGALISNRWVLTVAHKVSGRAGNSINLVVGARLLTSGGTTVRSDQIRIHPDFNFETMQNDLACVHSATTITIGQNIQSIFMLPGFINANENVQVSGWGAIENDKGENSNALLILTQRTISNDDCVSVYGNVVYDGHLCTTAITAGSGICSTDVGGPLILNANLVGIASWHPLPCGDSRPDVYTRISHYRSWITSVTSV